MSNLSVRDANNNIVSVPITPIGQTNANNSVSVVIATDQTTISTKSAIGSNNVPVFYSLNITTSVSVLSGLVTVPSWATQAKIVIPEDDYAGVAFFAGSTSTPPTANTGWPVFWNQTYDVTGVAHLNALQVVSATGNTVPGFIEFRG